MARQSYLLIAAASLALGACGGGGGGAGVNSTPPPPPSPPPPPPPTSAVTIFPSPSPAEYATVGASISGPGGNLDEYPGGNSQFGDVSTADADQAHIRYTSGGYYEIKMQSADWDRLVPYKGLVNPPADNNYFQPQSVAMNFGYLVTRNSRLDGYSYSELGSWGSDAAARWGYVAFGDASPAGGVPITGLATFAGVVAGSADIMSPDYLYGGYYPAGIGGTVTLNFDFGKGTFGGAMDLLLDDGMQPLELGTFGFTQTVFSSGSTTYSGKFNATAAGDNFFLGQFTGPNGEETIGAWAMPFVFDVSGSTLTADHQTHQAFGAWIAKKSN